MAVSRYPLLNGQQCLDPALLGLSPEDGASSITCPIGRQYGRAFFAVSRAVGDALDRTASQTLAWICDDGTTTRWQGYYIDRLALVNVDGDLQSAYLVELFDKRALLGLSGINARFNCLKPLPYDLSDSTQLAEKYFSDSLNSGSLHTWATVWAAIWAKLPAAIAGAAPSLPYTPAGTPKNFTFNGSAWEAAAQFLATICCTTSYDPVNGTFSVVRLSAVQTGLADALTAANHAGKLLFDSKDKSCNTTKAPASWFILSPRQHVQNDDHTEYGIENDIASGVSGAAGSTKEAIWISTPTTYCEDGGAQNASEVTARATDLATELSGKATNSNGDRHIEYSGVISSITTGSQVSMIRWRDYGDGDGMRTEIHQEPLELEQPDRQDINTDKIIRVRLDEILTTGGSAACTVVVFDGAGWTPDQCTLTIWDSLDFVADSLPVDLEVWAKWNYDSELWELLSIPPGNIIYFQLTADKSLTTQPASAVILAFNGTSWVSSGVACYIYDDYYNAPGFFTGKSGVDRGWAKLRKKNETPPDDYELIWMSGPAHEVQFTLGADRSAGAGAEDLTATMNFTYRYGHDQLAPTSVHFRALYFPWAFNGAKGTATYNDRTQKYEVVQCDQIALFGTGVLSADTCGGSVAIEEAAAGSFWPFSTLHSSLQGGGGTILNLCDHCGKAGDIVQFIWVDYLEEYSIFDVTRHTIQVLTGQRVTVTPGASGQDDTCVQEFSKQNICVELCEDPTWETAEYCCCPSGSGGTTAAACAEDLTGWYYLLFYDQTGDCTCFPDVAVGGGSAWTTATCPGNTTYSISCDATTGLPKLTVGGVGVATLISYTPGVEVRFQLPAMGANCGGGGGTAKVLITPGP